MSSRLRTADSNLRTNYPPLPPSPTSFPSTPAVPGFPYPCGWSSHPTSGIEQEPKTRSALDIPVAGDNISGELEQAGCDHWCVPFTHCLCES